MSWIELLGYIGSALMFSTFYMKTMIRLRLAGITANLFMITYTALAGVYPVLILQSCLLPLNVLRLFQVRRLIAKVDQAATADLDLDALVPFMKGEHHAAGTTLFAKGDKADKMYIIQKGSVRLPEVDVTLERGAVLGEIGIIHPDGVRTGAAECVDEVDVLTINHAHVLQLYYQSPEFGFYLLRLVTDRLLDNAQAASATA
jgi:hypothetical protein